MLQIPIGISDFKELRSGNYSYVDKSQLIVDLLNHSAKVMLLPRPRRFGKTLNLSMLAHFLSLQNPFPELFHGLAVERFPEIMALQNAFPTILVSFKDLKSTNWEDCQEKLKRLLSSVFQDQKEWLERLEPAGMELDNINDLIQGKATLSLYEDAFALLTKRLQRATGKRVVLLIDEYDTPIHAGFHYGYYREVVSFMRNLLSAGLKDNVHLYKGVVTGVLQVARESIFSGLNNLKVFTLLDEPFSTHFGFTQSEVDALLAPCGLDLGQVRDWYNGYRFGSTVIYNPWSILQVADEPGAPLQPHWVNTSDNELIRKLIVESNEISADELEQLLVGDKLIREVDKTIVFERKTPDAAWSLLLFSGYLTSVSTRYEAGRILCDLRIPNREVRGFFEKTIRDWVGSQSGPKGLAPFFKALLEENIDALQAILSNLLLQILSYNDIAGKEPERVYHVFFLGMLIAWSERYELQSNRESGWGRYDLCLFPKQSGQKGYLIEFKRGEDQEKAAEAALAQIEKQAYFAAFEVRGVQQALLLGIGLNGKSCKILGKSWRSSNPATATGTQP